MSPVKVLLFAGLIGSAFLILRLRPSPKEVIFEPPATSLEAQSPAAWDEVESQLTNWFPNATGYVVQDLILSDKRLRLEQRLGRAVLSDELALHSYTIRSNELELGAVLPRRVKAEHGAVEFVIALNQARQITHFALQRMREPAEIAESLNNFALEKSFAGKTAGDDFSLKTSPPGISSAARELAAKISREVRALLILYEEGYGQTHAPHH